MEVDIKEKIVHKRVLSRDDNSKIVKHTISIEDLIEVLEYFRYKINSYEERIKFLEGFREASILDNRNRRGGGKPVYL
jgi:hypothetical protein